ncbi:MAG TPA: hypothetical protein DDY20_08445 [Desulfobulbaceae bacterium]|nr:hypothetical protein [Desulfobulbaceae bacterium]
MMENKPTVVRMFGLLHTLRTKEGLPVTVELFLSPEGKAAREIALELRLPLEKIEAVFCNHTACPLDHTVMPGDRVAFVPYGTPGPHRYCLGIKQAGDRSR